MLLAKTLRKLFFILSLPALLALFIIWILVSNSGLRSSLFLLNHLTSSKIVASNLKGNLLHDITADQISYADEDVNVSVKNFAVNFDLAKLFNTQIFVNRVAATALQITLKPTPAPGDLELFFKVITAIRIANSAVGNVTISEQGQENSFIINSVNITTKTINPSTEATSVRVVAPGTTAAFDITGNGHLNVAWQITSNLNSLNKAWQGSIDGKGTTIIKEDTLQIAGNLIGSKIKIAAFKLKQGRVNANLEWNNGLTLNNQLNINLENLHFMQNKCDQINIVGKIENTQNAPVLRLNIMPTSILLASTLDIKIAKASLETSIDKYGANLQASLNLQDESAPILFNLKLPKYYLKRFLTHNQKLLASLSWQPKSLKFINAMLPQTAATTGDIVINLKADGTLANPKWRGELIANALSFDLLPLKTKIRASKIIIKATPTNITYSGNVASGAGTLVIDGITNLQHEPTSIFNINGKDFLLANNDQDKIIISPKIKIELSKEKTSITGEILIPEANINYQNSVDTLTLPNDVVFVSAKPSADLLNNNIYSQIKLKFGDKISVNTMGLKTKLTGYLNIKDGPNMITTATGMLLMQDASYNIYGQSLKITNGSFNFTNTPVTNPLVNFQASRSITVMDTGSTFSPATSNAPLLGNNLTSAQPTNATVGINVQGPLNHLKTTLFSVPSGMSSTDILSYLLLGEGSGQIGSNSSNAQLLLSAASALNFGGVSEVNKVLQNIKGTFGLSDLSISSDPTLTNTTSSPELSGAQNPLINNTSVLLGKYLTPRIYMSYSMGIIDQVNLFKVSYILGKNWTVQSETGSNNVNGVDLLYHIERE